MVYEYKLIYERNTKLISKTFKLDSCHSVLFEFIAASNLGGMTSAVLLQDTKCIANGSHSVYNTLMSLNINHYASDAFS